jgi:hypothetical protein
MMSIVDGINCQIGNFFAQVPSLDINLRFNGYFGDTDPRFGDTDPHVERGLGNNAA